MGVKSDIVKAESPGEDQYPYLGIYWHDLWNPGGKVVLFTGPRTGFVVYDSSGDDSIGSAYAGGWAENAFLPFSGTLVLSNT